MSNEHAIVVEIPSLAAIERIDVECGGDWCIWCKSTDLFRPVVTFVGPSSNDPGRDAMPDYMAAVLKDEAKA